MFHFETLPHIPREHFAPPPEAGGNFMLDRYQPLSREELNATITADLAQRFNASRPVIDNPLLRELLR